MRSRSGPSVSPPRTSKSNVATMRFASTTPRASTSSWRSSRTPRTEPLTAHADDIPAEYALQGFDGVRVYGHDRDEEHKVLTDTMGFEETAPGEYQLTGRRTASYGYDDPPHAPGLQGAGTVHHIAWCDRDDEHEAWRGAPGRGRPAPHARHRPPVLPQHLLPRAAGRPVRAGHPQPGLRRSTRTPTTSESNSGSRLSTRNLRDRLEDKSPTASPTRARRPRPRGLGGEAPRPDRDSTRSCATSGESASSRSSSSNAPAVMNQATLWERPRDSELAYLGRSCRPRTPSGPPVRRRRPDRAAPPSAAHSPWISGSSLTATTSSVACGPKRSRARAARSARLSSIVSCRTPAAITSASAPARYRSSATSAGAR